MANILIVDDEYDITVLLKFLMEQDGHCVSVARHGGEALALLGVEPPRMDTTVPDLILLDVMMPVMDGCEVATRLSTHDRLKDVPVFVLTARRDMRGFFKKFSNVVSCIDKPFDPKVLQEAVASVTNG